MGNLIPRRRMLADLGRGLGWCGFGGVWWPRSSRGSGQAWIHSVARSSLFPSRVPDRGKAERPGCVSIAVARIRGCGAAARAIASVPLARGSSPRARRGRARDHSGMDLATRRRSRRTTASRDLSPGLAATAMAGVPAKGSGSHRPGAMMTVSSINRREPSEPRPASAERAAATSTRSTRMTAVPRAIRVLGQHIAPEARQLPGS